MSRGGIHARGGDQEFETTNWDKTMEKRKKALVQEKRKTFKNKKKSRGE